MRPFFIHAGLPKTGTTYLQSIFFASHEELARQGLALLPAKQSDHLLVTLKLRGLLRDDEPEQRHQAVRRFAEEVAACEAPSALLTQESLAPLKPEEAAELVDALDGWEPHLIVTARDLGRQIPSAWQQRIQGRQTFSFAEFLDAVKDRTPMAHDLWINQDLVDVITRWSKTVPPERIHVLIGGPSGGPPDLLLRQFCGVVGIDPSGLDTQAPTANVSLGQAQAEMLRRVNVALGDRFPSSRQGYRELGQGYLAGQILRLQKGRAAKLPYEMRGWAEELSEEWIAFLRSSGVHLVGDLEDLRPRDEAFEESPTVFTEAEILDVAATAFADALEIRHREQRATRRKLERLREEKRTLRQENRRLRKQLAEQSAPPQAAAQDPEVRTGPRRQRFGKIGNRNRRRS